MTENQDLISVTAFFSALAHAVVILGISFQLPDIAEFTNTDHTLDVVLVNSNNNLVDPDAELVSTSDNTGGGEDDQVASSPIPYETVTASPVQSFEKNAPQQTTTQITEDQLITAPNSTVTVANTEPVVTQLENQNEKEGKDKIAIKTARQLERERLIAKINKNWQDYQKRPKKEFLSPSTKALGAAKYLEDWRKRVVNVGNANYPTQARAKGLTGSLVLTVEINRNGTINSIKINNPSQHKLLNDAALRFVRNASPFSAFPDEEYFKSIDILVITRAFHFLPDHSMTSTAIANPN